MAHEKDQSDINYKVDPPDLTSYLGRPAGAATGVTDARNRGLTYYWTGRWCKHGHLSYRYAASGSCVECDRIRLGNKSHKPGAPVAPYARYAYLPCSLRELEDRRVAAGIPQQTLSKRLGHGVNWYNLLLDAASDDGEEPKRAEEVRRYFEAEADTEADTDVATGEGQ